MEPWPNSLEINLAGGLAAPDPRQSVKPGVGFFDTKVWDHPKDCWLEYVWFIWFIKSSQYNLAVSKWGPSNSTEMVDFDAKQRTILKGSWIPLLYADLYCIYMRSWQELESPIPSKHGMEKTCLRCPRIGVVTFVAVSSSSWVEVVWGIVPLSYIST